MGTSCDKVENYLMLSEYEQNLIKEIEGPEGVRGKRGRKWAWWDRGAACRVSFFVLICHFFPLFFIFVWDVGWAENKSTSTHEQRIKQRKKEGKNKNKLFLQVNFGQCLAGFWLGVRIEVFQRLRKEKGDFLRQMYQGSGSRDISVFSYLTIQKVYLKTKVIHKTRVIVPISEKNWYSSKWHLSGVPHTGGCYSRR